ncbi:Hypothetical predicted protein [Mytilus galloprovincialis]|uniref:Reverse transcriptase domain-containing protein n=1 Tax=Mytilus galloprovincialis TaxID=29158 RepID=A0A8B6D8U9_MYTGA|nr:Hypothetical predicted protein [Mytilus galloprovincialis]
MVIFYLSIPILYRLALNNADFVKSAINDLLARGLIVETLDTSIPFVVNPLTVAVQSNNKKRLILDLREINRHLWKQSVKFEDMRIAKHYINAHSYIFKYDVHSAYHHVDIFPPHTKYLGFAWELDGVKNIFKFLVLPFGLSTACYIFTKLTRPLIKKWRGEGKQIIMYLDDGLDVHDDKELCTQMSIQVKKDIISSGFVPKAEKSMWTPTKNLTFLGTHIDTDKGIFTIPDNRIDKIMSTISDIDLCLSKSGKVFVRKVASLELMHKAHSRKYSSNKGILSVKWISCRGKGNLCITRGELGDILNGEILLEIKGLYLLSSGHN